MQLRIKRRFLLLLTFVLAAVLVGCQTASETPAAPTTAPAEPTTAPAEPAEPTTAPVEDSGSALPDLGGREVTVAVENAYLPFNYIDLATGEPAGWDYDVIGVMAELLNFTPVYVTTPWEGMIQAVADGEYDMAADGITITEERAQIVDFSDGYIAIEQRLLVRIDEDRFTNADEFVANAELIMGTQSGTTNFETASALLPSERLRAYDQFGFAIEALVNGDVDAVIIDETAGQGYVGVNADRLKLVGDSLSSDQLGFIFPKGSDLVAPFNAALAQMMADGTLAEINSRYFTDAFTVTYDDIADPFATEGEPEGALPDLGGREVTVAVENAYLPFNYIDLATGEPAGWDYDVIGVMAELLNFTPVYVTTPWEGMIQAVADGEYDMAADGITITEERAQIVDFSDGYIAIEQRLLVRIDEDRFTNADEFVANAELVMGTQSGTTNFETASALLPSERLRAYDQFGFAIEALVNGDVDAVIIDETAGQGYVGVNADRLKLVGDSLSSDQLGFIFPKGSDLVAPFNAALAQMMADGTLAEINSRYFTDAFTITYDDIADPNAEE